MPVSFTVWCWDNEDVCMHVSTNRRHSCWWKRMWMQRFGFLSVKCFTHTNKEGTWNKGAHLFLRTNWSPSDRLNTNNTFCVSVLSFWQSTWFSTSPSSCICQSYPRSLNLYPASLWYDGKCLQTYVTLSIWQKGELRSSISISVSLCCNSILSCATVLLRRTSGFKDVHLPNPHIIVELLNKQVQFTLLNFLSSTPDLLCVTPPAHSLLLPTTSVTPLAPLSRAGAESNCQTLTNHHNWNCSHWKGFILQLHFTCSVASYGPMLTKHSGLTHGRKTDQ